MRSLSRISAVIPLILISVQNNKVTVLSHYLPSNDVKTPYEETTAVLSREIMMGQFEDWMGVYQKQYPSVEEKIHRMEIWLQNHLLIEEHNRKEDQSYTLGHNEFSDLSHEEFKEMYLLGHFSRGVLYQSGNMPTTGTSKESVTLRGSRRAKAISDVPSEVNWVEKGAVTAVKNQGHCGSCWAFSAAGSIEALVYLRTQKLTNISVQEFIDCDPLDHGCFGGYMNNAFRFDEGIKGMCSDEDYPYKGHKHWFSGCHKKECEDVPGSDVEAFVNVTGTDAGMIDALQDQPISVAIQADQRDFQFYKKGVYDADCGSKLDHGVLTVGYGSEEGKDYFLVKNSWGEKWGDEGYIKLARGDKYPDGQCGIHLMPSRPLL